MVRNLIASLEQKNIFTSKIAFARSVFAFGALCLLLFNDIHRITDINLLQTSGGGVQESFVKNLSIFHVFTPVAGKIISILILLSVFSGFLPQVTGILQAWVHLSICNSFLLIEGGDQVAANLNLMLLPVCLFDFRFNQWKNTERPLTTRVKAANVFFNVYYLLIILQVSVIYLHSAVGKFFKEEWLDGTCIHYWFINNVFGAPVWLQKIYNVVTLSNYVPLLTWSVMIFELGLFACVLVTNKNIKKFFLVTGLLFHFGIAVTHGLTIFFFSMAAALILYLDDDNIIYRSLSGMMRSLYNSVFRKEKIRLNPGVHTN
jgi:antimicrobial peptide system SdpB family protein